MAYTPAPSISEYVKYGSGEAPPSYSEVGIGRPLSAADVYIPPGLSSDGRPYHMKPRSAVSEVGMPLSPKDGYRVSTSFVDRVPSRFSEGGYSRQSSMLYIPETPASISERKHQPNHVPEATTTSPATPPIKSHSSMKKPFKQNPLYTMRKLEQYIHSPEEKLLTQLVKKNLDEMIHPAIIRDQMDPTSFKIFSETIFNCLKEKRTQRPNIDEILRNLENALAHQLKHNNHDQSVN
ncbi:hypothetical protein Tco_1394703 [Tanacetum coccineum]